MWKSLTDNATYIYCAVCGTTVELFAVRQNEKAKSLTYWVSGLIKTYKEKKKQYKQ